MNRVKIMRQYMSNLFRNCIITHYIVYMFQLLLRSLGCSRKQIYILYLIQNVSSISNKNKITTFKLNSFRNVRLNISEKLQFKINGHLKMKMQRGLVLTQYFVSKFISIRYKNLEYLFSQNPLITM